MTQHHDLQGAGLLVIGNEILCGRTADKNIHFIASRLFAMGIPLLDVRIVPDVKQAIIQALNALRTSYRYVFTTGGIGPTHDDITMEAVAKAFGVPLVEDPAARQALADYYGADHLNPARLRMAQVPQGAHLIPNSVSGAPGVQMDNVFILAGVPQIMQVMFEAAADRLQAGTPLIVRTVRCTVLESLLADALRTLAGGYPELDIGSYPTIQNGALALALVVKGADAARVTAAAADIAALVTAHGGTPVTVNGF